MTIELIIILVVINFIISLAYVLYHVKRGQKQKGIICGIVMLVVPVFGPLLYFLSNVGASVLRKLHKAYLNPEELSYNREKIRIIEQADMEKSINKVPIEEALIESDNENVRKVLLDVLKSDFESSIPMLMEAIENEDTEVSHYASSAISDVLSKFKRNQSDYEKQYQRDKNNLEILTSYQEYVLKFLCLNVFPPAEQNTYQKLHDELLSHLEEISPEDISADTYGKWVIWLVEHEERSEALKWLNKLRNRYEDELVTYKARLQYTYAFDPEGFKNTVKEIRSSSVVLDEEMLEIIRFFKEV